MQNYHNDEESYQCQQNDLNKEKALVVFSGGQDNDGMLILR